MVLAIEKVSGVAVATVPVVELDASNVAEFRRDMEPLLEAHSDLVLDLSRVRFIDSSGMGAVLSCLRRLSTRGGDLKLCGMCRQVRTVFELVRMHRIFDIYPSQEEAARAFAH